MENFVMITSSILILDSISNFPKKNVIIFFQKSIIFLININQKIFISKLI